MYKSGQGSGLVMHWENVKASQQAEISLKEE